MIRRKILAALCSLLQLYHGVPATAQQHDEVDRQWHFLNGISEVSLPVGCHAQVYKRPIIADDAALQLLPIDHIQFTDVTCIGSSISITETIFTNGGDVRIFAHDLKIAQNVSIDTRVYLPKSFSFVENLLDHSSNYIRPNVGFKSYNQFLSNQYSKSLLTALANYYEACFDCKNKGGQVFSPRLPDGLPIVQGYPREPEIVENDIRQAEASIIVKNLTSGDIHLYLSGSLDLPPQQMVSGHGYLHAFRAGDNPAKVPSNPVFNEERRWHAFRTEAPYPSRPWLDGLPICGRESLFFSLGAGMIHCPPREFAYSGRLRPLNLEAQSGQVLIHFTDLGNPEVSPAGFAENITNPYAFKINGRPIFGEESSFNSHFRNYIGHTIPLDYRPRISADVVPGPSEPLRINPELTDGSAGGLIDESKPYIVSEFEAPLIAHQTLMVENHDILFAGFMKSIYDRRLSLTLMGAIVQEAEATTIHGGYVLSETDFIVLTLNQTTRSVLEGLIRAEINRDEAHLPTDLHPFLMFSSQANPLLASRHGRSLHALAMANKIAINSGRLEGGLVAGISESFGGLFFHLSSNPVATSHRYTSAFIALEGVRAKNAVEAQVKLMRQEHLATYRFFVTYMTEERLSSLQSKIKELEAAVERAKSDSSLMSMAQDIPKIWKSAEASGTAISSFVGNAGVSINPYIFAAAVAAVSVDQALNKRDALIHSAAERSREAAELREKMIAVAEEGRELSSYLARRSSEIELARKGSLIEALITLDTQEIDTVFALLGRLALEATLPPKLGRSEFNERLGYLESYLSLRSFNVGNSVALEPEKVSRLIRVMDLTCSRGDSDCICLGEKVNLDTPATGVFLKTSLFGEYVVLPLVTMHDAGPICLPSFGLSTNDVVIR